MVLFRWICFICHCYYKLPIYLTIFIVYFASLYQNIIWKCLNLNKRHGKNHKENGKYNDKTLCDFPLLLLLLSFHRSTDKCIRNYIYNLSILYCHVLENSEASNGRFLKNRWNLCGWKKLFVCSFGLISKRADSVLEFCFHADLDEDNYTLVLFGIIWNSPV